MACSDLPVENLDGRLGPDDEVTDRHSEGNQRPAVPDPRYFLPEQGADRRETGAHAAQEQDQADAGIEKTEYDPKQLDPAEPPAQQLEEEEQRKKREDGDRDFPDIVRDGGGKSHYDVPCGQDFGNDDFGSG